MPLALEGVEGLMVRENVCCARGMGHVHTFFFIR